MEATDPESEAGLFDGYFQLCGFVSLMLISYDRVLPCDFSKD